MLYIKWCTYDIMAQETGKVQTSAVVITSGCIVGLNMDGLQPIPRESNDKDVAAMLDELTIEANEESFVIVLQHGSNDVS